jgi:predicted N-formylglutamate amidohydrolase
VPAPYKRFFASAQKTLDSHRGLDYGALDCARAFGAALGVAPFTATVTRLVVDLNRSPQHKNLFSEYTRPLSPAERAAALREHYWPYRSAVENAVEEAIRMRSGVLHISAHSFTPVLRGEVRNCDVGLLYDPACAGEVEFVERWRRALAAAAPQLRIRRNYPYRGISDALVTHLRRRHAAGGYLGVELEVNQKHHGTRGWRSLVAVLASTLTAVARA